MFRKSILLMPWILFAVAAHAEDTPVREPTRGELLYETHCLACHNTEVHWRDKEIAKDWKSLRAEVMRWQKFSSLAWTDKDIDAVTQYVNALCYHYRVPDRP